MSLPLSKTGARRLAEAEATIERGEKAFIEVAAALVSIREERLYREDYDTFEAYCQGRWHWTSRRARQLMAAAEIGTIVPVANEGQARALAGLEADEAIEVFEAAEAAGPVTAAAITKARHKIVGDGADQDRTGDRMPPTAPGASPTLTSEGGAPPASEHGPSPAPAAPPSVALDPALKMQALLSDHRKRVADWLAFDRHDEAIAAMTAEQRADYRSFVHSVWCHASATLDALDSPSRLKAVQ